MLRLTQTADWYINSTEINTEPEDPDDLFEYATSYETTVLNFYRIFYPFRPCSTSLNSNISSSVSPSPLESHSVRSSGPIFPSLFGSSSPLL
jgi:hypothetical protein